MERSILTTMYLIGAAFSVRLLLAVTGIADAVNSHLPNLATPGYIEPVLVHTLYGGLLFCMVLASGTTVLNLLRRVFDLSIDDIDILGFPAGLFICLGLSLLSCLGSVGGIVAALSMVMALLDYYRRTRTRLRLFDARLILVILLAILFGAHLAYMWKPTTAASMAGTVGIGDVTTYIGWYNSLKLSLVPFYNLGVEGEHLSYFNNLHSFYALALDFLPGFDIYLFILASLGTFYILSVAYMLHALAACRSRSGAPPFSKDIAFTVTVLVVAAARYPSWILESPPAVFLAPISLAVMYAVVRAQEHSLRLGFALALAVAGSAISKVVSVVVLASYPGLRLLSTILRRRRRSHFIWLGVLICAIGAYVFYMVGNFGHLFVTKWMPGPESWQRFQKKGWSEIYQVVPMLLRDAGLLLVTAGILKLRDWGLFITAVLAVTSNFLFSYLFTPTPTALLMLLAAYLITTPGIRKGAVKLILIGALLFLPHHIRHDPGQWQMMLLWVLTLGGSALVVLRSHAKASGSPNRAAVIGRQWRNIASIMFVGSLSLAALAAGDFRLGKKHIQPVSADMYDIWTNTRLRTPEDALVFTDQTGDDRDRLRGWNDYSLIARRQFYISSCSVSRLRYRHADRGNRLASNSAVLAGAVSPSDLALSRHYAGYYAVLSRERSVPRTFQMLYRNDGYALYEIR